MDFHEIWKWIKDKYVYVITFGIALLMILGAWVIGDIGPFGGKSMVLVDGVHQYLPFFSEYQRKLQELSSIQYTFDVGLGNNFVSLWSYYLSSPFNLIIILCAKSHLPMALNLIMSVKLILAALCFAYFLMHAGKKPVKNPGIIVFSLFYAFNSYVIGYYWNLMWLDCIFIFPIIILGMEKMFREKDSRMYILALLYSFICNYYISFMICLFLILWLFTFRFKSFWDLLAKGIRFGVASLTAAALGAFVLVPAYMGIMTTASAEFGLPEWKFYGSFVDTLHSHLFCSEIFTNQVDDAGTNLYCGIFTIFLAVIFFFIKNISLEKKVKYGLLLVLLVISFNNEMLNYIWHGFHNQYGIPNRFAFLYMFVLLMMAYEVYLKRKRIRLPMVVAAYLVSILFVIYCFYHAGSAYDTKVYVVTGIILTVYLIVFAFFCQLPKGKRIARFILLLAAVLEMAGNGLYGFKQVGSSDPEYYYGDTGNFETLKKRVEDADDTLCRSDILAAILVDEATWHNLRSIGIFGSTVRGEMVDIMGKLGFYTGANEYLYYGATPVTNALLGVKYVYARDGDFVNVDMDYCDSEDNVSVYKNPYTLPIGYMVDEAVWDFDTENSAPFTMQNELCGALTGVQPVFTTIYDGMKTQTYGTNLEVTLTDENNISYSKANGSARADMIYIIPRDMDLYVNCRGSNVQKIALLIDGKEVAFDRYQGQIFRVGNVKEGQMVTIQFVLSDGEDLSGNLYCYPMEFNKEQFLTFYNVLANQGMNVTKYSDTKIEGTISAAKDGIFMTSIPYDDGWDIYANGEKMDTFIVLDGFLAVDLEKGDYTIKMIYRCPGLAKGLVITIIGIIFFYLICYMEKQKIQEKFNAGKERMIIREEIYDEKEICEKSGDTGSGIGDKISSGNEGDSKGDAANC